MSETSFHDSVTVETEIKPIDDVYYLNITNFKFFGISEKAIQTDLTLNQIKKIDYDNFVRDISKDCYDEFYKSYEIGHNKPDKEIYEYVINDLGVNPSDIVFFDDRMENVEGAKELEIDARCVDVYHLVEYFIEKFDII